MHWKARALAAAGRLRKGARLVMLQNMKTLHRSVIALGLMLAAPAHAQAPSPAQIVEAAPAGDWVTIAPSDLLVMQLAPDAKGAAREVVIQLMPAPFSAGWVGNIRKLAAAHWWDGLSVNRVQDNYVAQWGDADGDDKAKARKLPDGLAVVPEKEYEIFPNDLGAGDVANALMRQRQRKFDRVAMLVAPQLAGASSVSTGGDFLDDLNAIPSDPYAGFVRYWSGWPVASNGRREGYSFWPIHCYAMVGVARDMPPDAGTGAELYAVIATPPRHLDRNIALVGRVISGMENLSSLPRGTGDLGFYKTAAERTPILSVRLASELPAAQQPHFQYLGTESQSFAKYAEARANRRDPFFITPAGGADICNIPVPIRRQP